MGNVLSNHLMEKIAAKLGIEFAVSKEADRSDLHSDVTKIHHHEVRVTLLSALLQARSYYSTFLIENNRLRIVTHTESVNYWHSWKQ